VFAAELGDFRQQCVVTFAEAFNVHDGNAAQSIVHARNAPIMPQPLSAVRVVRR
jgi:hypothetical protein